MAASSTTLSIILKLVDDASGALKSAATGLDGSLKKLEPTFKTVAVASGAAFAAVTGEIYLATDAARESIKAHEQLAAVLKSTGGAAGVTADMAVKLADSMQNLTNFDDDAVLSMENILLTFTKINKDIFPETTQVTLDIATAMHEDLQEAAVQVGKALQDPVLGMTALRRIGVSFSDDQVEVVKQLVATGQSAQAQAMILKELEREFGGSAKAAADPVIQLQNAVGDLQKEIGKALIPVLNQMMGVVQPVVVHLMEWVDAHPKLTAGILAVSAATFGLIAAVATLGLVLAALLPVAASLGITVLALVGWMALIPIAIAAIVTAGYLLIKHWDAVKESVGEFIEKHKLLIVLLSDLFPAGAVTAALIKGILWMIQHWQLIEQEIAQVVSVFESLIDIYNKVAAIAAKPIKFVVNAVGSAVSSFTSALPHFASGGIVNGPTVALVGEAGPEAIVPLSGAGRGALGSAINIYIQGGYYLDEQASGDFADMIAKKLNQQLRLRSI